MIFAVSALLHCAMAAQNSLRTVPSNDSGNTDAVIDELVATPDFGIVYVADGAGDGTVLNDRPSTAVKDIVKIKDAAIPILIRHLDDMRLTSARYKGGGYWNDPIAVPVGYVCLDILSQIVRDNKTLFVEGRRDCDLDGVGACIEPPYYFDPFNYTTNGKRVVPGKQVLIAKRNWEYARNRGLLKFRFPSSLERYTAAYSASEAPAGRARKQPCTDAEARAALDGAVLLRTWVTLYRSYKSYRQCDDGAIGEGYSESVARILVDHWNSLPDLADFTGADGEFRSFVIKHIDATLNMDDVEKIKRSAETQCPSGLRTLCTALAQQADAALKEGASSP